MGKEYTRDFNIIPSGSPGSSIILSDELNEGKMFEKTGMGGDFVHEISDTFGYSHLKSLHLKTRTTDTAEGDWIGANRSFPFLTDGKISVECLVYVADYTNIQSFEIMVDLSDRSRYKQAIIRYNAALSKFQYFDSAGDIQDVPGGALDLTAGLWHKVQFIFDFNGNKYVSLLVNNVTLDLSEIAIYDVSATTYWGAGIQLTVSANEVGPAEIWFDNIAIRQAP